jgi:hypothetical protein
MNSEWLMAWATVALAVATVILAVISAFQDKIREWLSRPKLDLSVDLKPPDCLKIPLAVRSEDDQNFVDAYYFRLRVSNRGNAAARGVEVFAGSLLRCQAGGEYKLVDEFLPMNLAWANLREIFWPFITPGTHKYCDLLHVIDPEQRPKVHGEHKEWPNTAVSKTVLSFDTIVQPTTLSHLVPYGKYRLDVTIAAANARPVKKIIEIVTTGDWYDDERRMLGEGVDIRVVS